MTMLVKRCVEQSEILFAGARRPKCRGAPGKSVAMPFCVRLRSDMLLLTCEGRWWKESAPKSWATPEGDQATIENQLPMEGIEKLSYRLSRRVGSF